MELHADMRTLAPLLGTWLGHGSGQYPTIADFSYTEELTFAHVGKPFLAFTQCTRGSDGRALHSETGYLRAPSPDWAEVVVAMPTGHVEVGSGPISCHPLELVIETTSAVHRTDSAKQVDRVVRTLRLEADTLSYTLDMAAVGQPVTRHLEATLRRRADY